MSQVRKGVLLGTRSAQAPVAPKHLRQRQLARRWGVSEQTLANWRWQRIGPSYLKIGGRILYRLEDIEQFETENLKIHAGTRGCSD